MTHPAGLLTFFQIREVLEYFASTDDPTDAPKSEPNRDIDYFYIVSKFLRYADKFRNAFGADGKTDFFFGS